MAIIIGSATTVNWSGVISAQWGVNPQVNRLWQLGSWQPYRTHVTTVETVSLTVYAGAGPTIPLAAATSCVDSNAKINVNISPAGCTAGAVGTTGFFFLSSYSYSKGDAIGLGQQSYSAQRWVTKGDSGNIIYSIAPTRVIQGASEGNESKDTGLVTGVTFANGYNVEGSQGSVSAGFPGVGSSNTVTYGIANQISNGSLKNDGKVGQAQVNIPHQPLYF